MWVVYYILRHYVTAHPTALFSVVTRLNGSCGTRRFLQNLAEVDGSCRTRRVLQNSTVLAGLDGSCSTRRFLQNSTVLAELDGSCRTRRFLQNSTVLAELDGSHRQNSTVLAFHHPFGRYGTSYALARAHCKLN